MGLHVSGVFLDAKEASRAVDRLVEAGFGRDRIGVVMSEHTRARYFPEEPTKAPEGAAVGGGIGALTGGIVALFSLAVPGGIVAAGPLAVLLTGGAAGAVSGGLLGGLVGAGIPDEHARKYERWVLEGGIVVEVEAPNADRAATARGILEEAGAVEPIDHRPRTAGDMEQTELGL